MAASGATGAACYLRCAADSPRVYAAPDEMVARGLGIAMAAGARLGHAQLLRQAARALARAGAPAVRHMLRRHSVSRNGYQCASARDWECSAHALADTRLPAVDLARSVLSAAALPRGSRRSGAIAKLRGTSMCSRLPTKHDVSRCAAALSRMLAAAESAPQRGGGASVSLGDAFVVADARATVLLGLLVASLPRGSAVTRSLLTTMLMSRDPRALGALEATALGGAAQMRAALRRIAKVAGLAELADAQAAGWRRLAQQRGFRPPAGEAHSGDAVEVQELASHRLLGLTADLGGERLEEPGDNPEARRHNVTILRLRGPSPWRWREAAEAAARSSLPLLLRGEAAGWTQLREALAPPRLCSAEAGALPASLDVLVSTIPYARAFGGAAAETTVGDFARTSMASWCSNSTDAHPQHHEAASKATRRWKKGGGSQSVHLRPLYLFDTPGAAADGAAASWLRSLVPWRQGEGAASSPEQPGNDGANPQLFAGAAGSGSPVHVHRTAANVLAHGRKLWALLPPGGAEYSTRPPAMWMELAMRKHGGPRWARRLVGSKPQERLGGHDGGAHPGIGMLWCEQRAGDIVVVPDGWGHAVLNLEPSSGVALELRLPVDG